MALSLLRSLASALAAFAGLVLATSVAVSCTCSRRHRSKSTRPPLDTDSPSSVGVQRGRQSTMCGAPRAKFFLLLHNITKRSNIGNLLRCAAAFGCEEVVCVGFRKARDIPMFGSQNSEKQLRIRCFIRLQEAVSYLKSGRRDPFLERDETLRGAHDECDIVGIEIVPEALSVADPAAFASSAPAIAAWTEEGGRGGACAACWQQQQQRHCDHPLSPSSTSSAPRDVCFIPGSEGVGMLDMEKEVCDRFVYVPQFSGGTASLNVCNATSVVLFAFTAAAGYKEFPRCGEKFVVMEPNTKGFDSGAAAEAVAALPAALCGPPGGQNRHVELGGYLARADRERRARNRDLRARGIDPSRGQHLKGLHTKPVWVCGDGHDHNNDDERMTPDESSDHGNGDAILVAPLNDIFDDES